MRNLKRKKLNYGYLKGKVKDPKEIKFKMLSYLFKTRQLDKAKLISRYLKVGYSV